MTAGTAKAYSTDTYTDMNGIVHYMDYDNLPPYVERCSQELSTQLSVRSSTTDRACMKRTDWMYRNCVVQLTKKLDSSAYQDKAVDRAVETCAYLSAEGGLEPEKALSLFTSCSSILGSYLGERFAATTGLYCARAKTYDFAQCASTLGKNGVNDGRLLEELCNSSIARPVTNCVFQKTLGQAVDGKKVVQSCREQLDPELRRQAEERRMEEQRRRDAEIRAAQEAARQAEAARLEAQRQAEEQKRREEQDSSSKQNAQPGKPQNTVKKDAPKKEQPKVKPAPSPAPAPAPQDPQEGNGGVIVDLPNF